MTDKLNPYIEIASQIWCRPECREIEMNVTLGMAFAETMREREDAMQRVVEAVGK